ncbi:MAG: amidohydrolase [Bacillota bacterium]|nr:MAG: amidohydrolase [Bacillota bacterium]
MSLKLNIEQKKEAEAMDINELKTKVCAAIDLRRGEIIAIGDYLFKNPELGYKEVLAARLVADKFRELGLSPREEIAVTGVVAEVKGKSSKVRLSIMGELDAVVCPEHPHADKNTGAAHSCGHNAQIAGMLGAAMGLIHSGAIEHLDGDIVLMGVPAEEYVEIEYRQKLREEGKISFLGGKQEFLVLGELDGIDLCMMFHTSTGQEQKIAVGGSSNGFVGKLIKYKGKEAHAGGAPHAGVNALNAAMLGMMGIHAQRETFRDEDHIRVHPIITKGGDLVNIIPADVRMETYVRGAKIEPIMDASKKVDRALQAGAMAMGADVEIIQLPGYLPRINEDIMSGLFRENAVELLGAQYVGDSGHGSGSSDIGDVSHIMPTVHPYVGGATGRGHAQDFMITDQELAYIVPAKAMAMTAVDLLFDGAANALKAKENFSAPYTRDSYLKMWKELI